MGHDRNEQHFKLNDHADTEVRSSWGLSAECTVGIQMNAKRVRLAGELLRTFKLQNTGSDPSLLNIKQGQTTPGRIKSVKEKRNQLA